jgi:uncharacterized ion transporter superfamily protein YfcC
MSPRRLHEKAHVSDHEQHDRDAGNADRGEQPRSPFPHPDWTVGLVLVAGVITLLFGVLVRPIWLVVGSPFLIALGLWLYVKVFVRPDQVR